MPWGTSSTATRYNGYITSNYITTGGSIYDSTDSFDSTYATSGTAGGTVFYNVLTNVTNATVGFAMGFTSVGSYTSARRGFAPDQVSAIRTDFDQVKKDWKRKRAEVKARRLFHKIVGTIRYKRFRELGYHEIVGATGRRYRLAPGQWVKVMTEDDKIEHLLCAHLEFGIPWFDTMIVQHLMITSSKETEKQFLKLANVHDVAGPYPIPELQVA